MATSELPFGAMHDLIRRVYEEVYVAHNYSNAIKISTTALAQSGSSELSVKRGESCSRWANESSSEGLNDVTANDLPSTSSFGSSTKLTRSSTGLQGSPHSTVAHGVHDKRPRSAPVKLVLNEIQRFHLLLLRAEAHSAAKQHEKALHDAESAVKISKGRSPEAYFFLGRELLRLYRIVDSVVAFDRAESLLLTCGVSEDESFLQEVSEEDYWAQRGYTMVDVEAQGLERSMMEPSLVSSRSEREGLDCTAMTQQSTRSSLFKKGNRCGYLDMEKWGRFSREARALLTVQTSHMLPINSAQTTLPIMARHIDSTRNGIVACIQNTTNFTFRLVGCSSPMTDFHSGTRFPPTILPGHCGVALLEPRSWRGYVGYICYQVSKSGMCCFFLLENSLFGSTRCGVLFESGWFGDGCEGTPHTRKTHSTLTHISKFIIPPSNRWHAISATTFTKDVLLKAWGSIRGGARVFVFTVATVMSVNLQAVELLAALEFAGPVVLKKLSAVSRRYRELVNNLPPTMFFGSDRVSYPDYCLHSDRFSSPWVVRDKIPVKWLFIFDGQQSGREVCIVTDSTEPQNIILIFSWVKDGSMNVFVHYGSCRTQLARISSGWIPFDSTLYISTPSDRIFATCFTGRASQLTLSWGSGGSKSKPADIEYVLSRKAFQWNESPHLKNGSPSSSVQSSVTSPRRVDPASLGRTSTGSTNRGSWSHRVQGRAARSVPSEVYSVHRAQKIVDTSASADVKDDKDVVADIVVFHPLPSTPQKGTVVGEVTLYNGGDALLLSLMTFCRLYVEN
ncbi:hypothetical protein ERJ75_000213900 [Trypanosoma vivax]|uniref:Uncharacterized protein n=1 Tax=Trypanosoma vivax (strain Y486) TaxID=1055687 RepID=G0U9V0_TRYVY|nr:hypothetical protein TRVL_07591 [Trypanosoma vivax]KAH8619040.1 hypothetical protein ERJ75_000213900 [Trypanosoma vivax]CCC52581.1 conserved hypothetical protein [Trypanosoma vivax Y486]